MVCVSVSVRVCLSVCLSGWLAGCVCVCVREREVFSERLIPRLTAPMLFRMRVQGIVFS